MHACGHDNHMAILLGAATVLSRMRAELPGTVKFIFQPAEEGPGGAEPMVKAGVLQNPKVDAVFGLHVFPFTAGTIVYRSGPLMASADEFTIEITGKQTHGAVPWGGVDPIVIGAQIVTSMQSIVSRTVNIAKAPAVVTVGKFTGRQPLEHHSRQGGAGGHRAGVRQGRAREDPRCASRRWPPATRRRRARPPRSTWGLGYPVTTNDPALTERMVPTLQRVAGPNKADRRAADRHRGGLLVLPAGGARPVLLPRRHAARTGGRPRHRTTRRCSSPTSRPCRSECGCWRTSRLTTCAGSDRQTATGRRQTADGRT